MFCINNTKLVGLVALIVILAVLVAGCSETKETTDATDTANDALKTPHQYDALQRLYCDIDPNIMNWEEIMQVVNNSKLHYTEQSRMTYGSTKISLNENSEDYLIIQFARSTYGEPKLFTGMEYYNKSSSVYLEQYHNNFSSGLYIFDKDHLKEDDKIETINYRGNKDVHDYCKLTSSKEEQFGYMDMWLKN